MALEVAIGGSFAGGRALCTMKHVGVNVAADPLFTVSYTGVSGGLVLVVADDPEMHSSQNEQDSRNYARFAKVPTSVGKRTAYNTPQISGGHMKASTSLDTAAMGTIDGLCTPCHDPMGSPRLLALIRSMPCLC